MAGTSGLPSAAGLDLEAHLAQYMRGRFFELLGHRAGVPPILPHLDIPTETAYQADRLAELLAEAARNEVCVAGFSLEEEISRASEHSRSLKHQKVDSRCMAEIGPLVELRKPSTIINEEGYVIAWYVPFGLSGSSQNRVWRSMKQLRGVLDASVKSAAPGGHWRDAPDLFRKGGNIKGCVNVSPAWYPQAHDHTNSLLKPSRSLHPQHGGTDMREWLFSILDINALLSASVSIMHPEMHSIGAQAMRKVAAMSGAAGSEHMADAMRVWPSVYNSLSAMVNRQSPFHLDLMGAPESFDLLLTVGNYADLHMVFPRLRLQVFYPPGTIMAFSGKWLLHGVGEADGDRACIAWYMQRKVHRGMNLPGYHHARNVPLR